MMFRIIEYNFIAIIIILLCETTQISGLYMFSSIRSKGTKAASGYSQVAPGYSQVAPGHTQDTLWSLQKKGHWNNTFLEHS